MFVFGLFGLTVFFVLFCFVFEREKRKREIAREGVREHEVKWVVRWKDMGGFEGEKIWSKTYHMELSTIHTQDSASKK